VQATQQSKVAGNMENEPTIIAFCCHYCAFTAADLAGTMRKQYPTNIRIVRIPCTGKVDENMVLQAFVEGADGVMVAGCEIGSCHFIQGNVRALKRVAHAKKLLAETGVNADRLEFFHVAASQGPLFATTSAEFTERIKQLTTGGDAPALATVAEDSTGEGS
jgi:F420-non-reducing hydrogenase iron-sulfur subunit